MSEQNITDDHKRLPHYQNLIFHHVGIPVKCGLPAESYNAQQQMKAVGYFDSPYAVEWMEFDEDCELPDIIQTQPHIAFVVDDLAAAIRGRELVLAPSSPAEGVTVAFVLEGRDLVEFLQFDKPEQEVWPHSQKFMLKCL
ncbi:hypothetical protein P2G88_00505 [Aliiglaciecola sp. CAU 1673]|uniref:hypothetical protein n=1 Tax=Aliiglaciecola sp. CAU 1673 TaxID=3032595 RepID=UPI0023D9EB73|nr:hypothetical protein [Aliiglaciecola sp. CAU 1673]MDF2176728.1 hypothetical protein [Aliiglaciecola sp. CAU 1673]